MNNQAQAVAPTPVQQFKLSDFFTVAAASAGRKMPVSLPDGTPTDHYLVVLGLDSKECSNALAVAAKEVRENTIESMSEEQKVDVRRLATINFRASLVKDWSFDVPCTPEAVREFLANSPAIAQDVEEFSSNRNRFFKNASKTS